MISSIQKLAIIACAAFIVSACQQDSQEQSEPKSTDKTVAQTASQTNPQEKPSDLPSQNESAEQADVAELMSEHNHDHENHAAPQSSNQVIGKLTERYEVVEPQVECTKPVVIEFYAYHCPHCYNLEPAAKAWREKMNGKVEFISIPTDLGNRQMVSLVLLHHAAKNLDILEKTKQALFHRFHEEKKLFGSEDEAAEFLVAQGAEKSAAVAALKDQKAFLDSYNVDFKLLNQYKVSSVPKILVNHKYMTDITLAGGHDEVFELVDELLTMESSCK